MTAKSVLVRPQGLCDGAPPKPEHLYGTSIIFLEVIKYVQRQKRT